MIPKLSDLIRSNRCYFSYLRQGTAYYTIDYCPDEEPSEFSRVYTFGFLVPLEEIGTATLSKEEKAITLMKWIRSSIENNTLILIGVTTKTN